MEEVIDKFQEELKTLRIGRANPFLLENLLVSYYGTQTPLRQMASITLPDSGSILITPWDKNSLGDIELTIRNSDLGLSPINDGRAIRIVFPPLTQERRDEMIKLVSRLAEEARVGLRQLRQEAWIKIKNLEKEKKITEDDRYQAEEELNRLIEEFNNKISESVERKKEELREV